MSTTIDTNLLLSKNVSVRNTGSNLGKDEFLKILMTQLQNQDPLNPMEDKEFISQMASFSSLEQMTNMSSLLSKFVNSQSGPADFLKYSELIGKEIEYKSETADNGVGVGIVKSIKQTENNILVELNDGTEVSSDLIKKISQA
ncbi:flagellar basal-body rod modification protein FlgD [Metabacillus crassostreae]|uniref:flagellar hook assembly protein FlgD n=1 Tax=Metabacillus crassostreae TaxID=929098 RepID=UPI0019571191|nr:flagellar hook assembly protein FlgD [Metabacillus crassostreae]MBM7603317.1 flagellar basal-body rod modification protein FlgD [Metabacillus crassostreae]